VAAATSQIASLIQLHLLMHEASRVIVYLHCHSSLKANAFGNYKYYLQTSFILIVLDPQHPELQELQ
jgi:hypothetical protein